MRYFCELSYHGANYKGWQIQKNAIGVQQIIQQAFSTILQEEIKVTGCGRTDTGVHAKFYVLHFDVCRTIENEKKICNRLNRFLPKDIAVHKIYRVSSDMHARFSALLRSYEYHIHFNKNPFLHQVSLKLPRIPNFDLMNESAHFLLKTDDFSSFAKLHSDVKNHICKITEAYWKQTDSNCWVFKITANRFLRNMVRAITGTLLEIGYEKINHEQFIQIVLSKNRSKAGTSVPAHGLFLSHVVY